ncbi:MAG: hypothetical protein HZA93_23930 [Verrucomicrobia bacterium]|nr:hypothetical protein [Verrucomicrobiota bacterium]
MRPKISTAVVFGRMQVCAVCPVPCDAYRAAQIDYTVADASCPAEPPRWRPFPAHHRPAPLGLGDVVASVAQPIARAIDAVAGTNLKGCGGCAGRKARLNQAVPDIARPFRREGAKK